MAIHLADCRFELVIQYIMAVFALQVLLSVTILDPPINIRMLTHNIGRYCAGNGKLLRWCLQVATCSLASSRSCIFDNRGARYGLVSHGESRLLHSTLKRCLVLLGHHILLLLYSPWSLVGATSSIGWGAKEGYKGARLLSFCHEKQRYMQCGGSLRCFCARECIAQASGHSGASCVLYMCLSSSQDTVIVTWPQSISILCFYSEGQKK